MRLKFTLPPGSEHEYCSSNAANVLTHMVAGKENHTPIMDEQAMQSAGIIGGKGIICFSSAWIQHDFGRSSH
jgi:hypothetical protein